MTNQDAPYKTMGFCATCERYTVHVCTKCREHDASMLPRVDLALVKEVQDLRTQNERQAALLSEIDDLALNALGLPGEIPLAEALHEIIRCIAKERKS